MPSPMKLRVFVEDPTRLEMVKARIGEARERRALSEGKAIGKGFTQPGGTRPSTVAPLAWTFGPKCSSAAGAATRQGGSSASSSMVVNPPTAVGRLGEAVPAGAVPGQVGGRAGVHVPMTAAAPAPQAAATAALPGEA